MIGERIRQLRGKVPQADFGVKFGLSRNTVMRYESGARDPDAGLILALCQEYNINAHWLITGEGPKCLNEQVGPPAAGSEPANVSLLPSDNLGLGESVELLAKIYNSGNKVLIRAIAANLNAFGEAIDNKALAQKAIDMMDGMNRRILAMENDLAKLKEENEALRKDPPGHKQQAEG